MRGSKFGVKASTAWKVGKEEKVYKLYSLSAAFRYWSRAAWSGALKPMMDVCWFWLRVEGVVGRGWLFVR